MKFRESVLSSRKVDQSMSDKKGMQDKFLKFTITKLYETSTSVKFGESVLSSKKVDQSMSDKKGLQDKFLKFTIIKLYETSISTYDNHWS